MLETFDQFAQRHPHVNYNELSKIYKEAQERDEADMKRKNDEARAAYKAQLQAEKDRRAAAQESEIDRQLAPVKEREKRRWLAEHPGHSAEDFERRAWPKLRANLVEDRQRKIDEQQTQALRASGDYQM